MMRKIFIISFFIFIGCNQLVEKTSPLDGIYYVLDGWEQFEDGEHDRAHDLFSTVLLNNTSQYFVEAYVGLAWNSIYKANTIQGSSNFSDREYQRDISNQYLDLAIEYHTDSCPPINIDDCSVLCQNLLTGRIYNSSYQALEASRRFYDYGLDSTNWFSMVDYSNETIAISDTLLGQCNSEYIFNHDPTVTFIKIRILRAQTHVRLKDFESAYSELILVNNPDCISDDDDRPVSEIVLECLNSLDID